MSTVFWHVRACFIHLDSRNRENQREIIVSVCISLSKHYLLFMWHFWQRSRHMNTNQFFGEREVSEQIMAICAAALQCATHTHVSARVCVWSVGHASFAAAGIVRRASAAAITPHSVRPPRWQSYFHLSPLCGSSRQSAYANYRAVSVYSHSAPRCTRYCWGYSWVGAKVRHQMTMIWGACESANVCVLPGHSSGVNNVPVFATPQIPAVQSAPRDQISKHSLENC